MRTFVYHFKVRFEKYEKGYNEVLITSIANFDSILVLDGIIGNIESYDSVKQAIWDTIKDQISPCFTIDDMQVNSLSFLHEVDE